MIHLILSIVYFLYKILLHFEQIKHYKNHNIILQIYANIILVISFAVAYDKINYNVFNHIWIIILVFISYCYAFYKNLKFEVYEIISFVIANILLSVIFNNFELYDYIKYIFFITTIIITTLQYFSKRLQNISTKVYLVTSFIFTFGVPALVIIFKIKPSFFATI